MMMRTINKLGGKYAGLDRYEARKADCRRSGCTGTISVVVEDHVHMRLVPMTDVRQR